MMAAWPEQLICGPVVLERFGAGDIGEDYLSWLNDPEVVRYSNQRFVRHDGDSARAYLASFDRTDSLLLAIRSAAEGALIGTMTAYRSRQHGTADMGIMIGDRAVWGRGHGEHAWSGLMEWLLQPGGTRKVTAGTLACNRAMIRLMEKSGMTLEGVRKDQEIVAGQAEDIVLYARFASWSM